MNRTFLLIGLIVSLLFTSCKKEKVTLASLLGEMTDREVLTRLPEKPYTLKQYSSYDRESTTPSEDGWWANADFTQFIREEENNGRREFVLFDAEGPGAVVRWWMTFAGEGAADGTVRIYIDNKPEPVIEGDILELLSGEMLAEEPLAASVSHETEYGQRGHNLYLPLPYDSQCKITYECDAVEITDEGRRPSIYYNICYRTYEKGVEVESISPKVVQQNRELIDATGRFLLAGYPEKDQKELSEEKTVASGESLILDFEGSGKAVSYLSAALESENLPQALRSTVLSISFDGEETVWIPVGEFFGTGYQIFPSDTWYTKVFDNGKMESYWQMPFKENVEIKFTNFGEETVKVQAAADLENYKWSNSSLYFGAAWKEHYQINTAKDPDLDNHKWHFDVNYVDLKGQGLYVGDALTVFNTADAWWGEGDEKIFVDGEEFPSFIGTGTEDYYGYAWCRPEKFTHPFIAQPTGAGNFHPGMTVNMRYRTLDAIPFQSEISSNIELWHWAKTTINFAMSSFWYAR
ncbi:MAG: glycoside hydrolase family 172 protein, partial [Bacteroidota bacterium]